MISLLLVIHFHGSLPLLVLAMAGSPLVALLVNGTVMFGVRCPWLLPSWSCVSVKASKDLCRLGAFFLALQLAFAISYSSDNLVLARVLGPGAVAQYSVPCKLFALVSMIVSFVVGPLWPAYGEALARRDHIWIRETLSRSLTFAAGTSLLLAPVIVLFGGRLINLWVGAAIKTSPLLMIGLGIWSVVTSLSSAVASFNNGLSIFRFQLVVASLGALSNIALSVALTRRIGIPGVVYGSILSQVFVILIPSICYIRNYLRVMVRSAA